jgi:hypothetical protein
MLIDPYYCFTPALTELGLATIKEGKALDSLAKFLRSASKANVPLKAFLPFHG